MGRMKIILNKKLLNELYIDRNLTPDEIGRRFKCSFKTVRNRLQEFGIPFKSPAFARMRYKKSDCTVNPMVKAYMVGFRIGDLNVYNRGEKSETIVVRCHTTHKVQVSVIKSLFNSFGRVTISPRGQHYTVNCFLNRSFEFLLFKDERAWEWIKKDDVLIRSFVAGYSDAEGNFIINQKRGRFKIDSYDFSILEFIYSWMLRSGIHAKFRCIRKKGPSWAKQPSLNNDLWRLNVNSATALERFVNSILPFLRHANRIRGAKECLKNIVSRRKNETIK